MVGVAQLVEHLVVVQDVAGSSPVTHPTDYYGAGEYLVASPLRVKPSKVKPNSRAVSTASEVGAETATTAEIPAATAF